MFVGHYGVSFAARRFCPEIPLWVLFVAVQLLDVVWAPLILLGVEKVRIVPGITASSPLDLYYMPYTHSLVAALLWSAVGALAWRLSRGGRPLRTGALVVGAAVFSHWALDLVVHRPDLPLYDNTAKLGLGLWNHLGLAFALETGLLLGGLALYLRGRGGSPVPMLVFAGLMLVIHSVVFFGAPPGSPAMAALMALGSYVVFAAAAGWLEARQTRLVSGIGG
jgi:hypothetical protein